MNCSVYSDNGPPFNSKEFVFLARRLGFEHRRITPYWPRANGEVERCMRNLTKVVQNAKIKGISKEMELRNFLRVYRDTPHSTTKVPPASLMFGRSTHSGIPSLSCTNKYAADPIHALARRNDEEAKAKMKEHFDQVMKTRERHLEVGKKVLVKQDQKRKSDTFWDPKPLIITEMKGSMITASREDKRVTRNSSFFKLFMEDLDDLEDIEIEGKIGSSGSLKELTDGFSNERGEKGHQVQGNMAIVERKKGRPTKEESNAKLRAKEDGGPKETIFRKSARLQEKAKLSNSGGKM